MPNRTSHAPPKGSSFGVGAFARLPLDLDDGEEDILNGSGLNMAAVFDFNSAVGVTALGRGRAGLGGGFFLSSPGFPAPPDANGSNPNGSF